MVHDCAGIIGCMKEAPSSRNLVLRSSLLFLCLLFTPLHHHHAIVLQVTHMTSPRSMVAALPSTASTEVARSNGALAPECSVPIELLMCIIEHVAPQVPAYHTDEEAMGVVGTYGENGEKGHDLAAVETAWVPGKPQGQLALAALRLSSKLLYRLATPHFYQIIQLSSSSHLVPLISQLQAQPKLCDTTRAIWWDAAPDDVQPLASAEPELIKLANVDEVAFCLTVKTPLTSYSVGVHYALRDVGPWCEGEGVTFPRPDKPIEQVQGTPTLRIALGDASGPDGQGSNSSEQHGTSTRAVWAAHVVLPGFSQDLDTHEVHAEVLWVLPRTITHLTITLYSHAFFDSELALEDHFIRLVQPDLMPLIEYIDIRSSSMGESEPLPDPQLGEDPGGNTPYYARTYYRLYRDTSVEHWLGQSGAGSCTDAYEVGDVATPQANLFEDVRNYTLHQWQERVFHGRAGPWKDPQTRFAKPQPLGDWHSIAGIERPEYAPDADFEINESRADVEARRARHAARRAVRHGETKVHAQFMASGRPAT